MAFLNLTPETHRLWLFAIEKVISLYLHTTFPYDVFGPIYGAAPPQRYVLSTVKVSTLSYTKVVPSFLNSQAT